MSLHDPIVIDPPGFDPAAAWGECRKAQDNLAYADGSVNWKAAFSADPGVVSCPTCRVMHWAWGARQRCTQCDFEYPVGWWGMYSWGVQAGRRAAKGHAPGRLDRERMAHPYFAYGYAHPVEDPFEERFKIDWRAALAQ